MLPSEITNLVEETWLSARLIQCAGKQASGIVRGTRKKYEQRLFILNKLKIEGDNEGVDRLEKLIAKTPITKPNISSIEPELDSRFVRVDWENDTSFDGWITLSSIGNKIKILLPIRKTRHFNKLSKRGVIKPGIRLSSRMVTFTFDIKKSVKQIGTTIGIDIGITNLFSSSDNQVSRKDHHGHDLNSILEKISRRTKGSNRFKKAVAHRKNYIGWAINQLDLNNVNRVKYEDLKCVRKHKSISRKLSHWTYTDIIDKLDRFCEDQGVLTSRVNPAYTSQKCSACGDIRRSNRRGKKYKCRCGNTMDADMNAAFNLLSEEPIVPIPHIIQ